MYTKIKMESTFADFRMRYQIIIDDIKFIKTRQWIITYYLLLLFAAIIGFYEVIITNQGTLACGHKVILFTIALGVTVFGILFQNHLEKTLARYRQHLIDNILPFLSNDYETCEKDELKSRFGEKWYDKYTDEHKDFWVFTIYLDLMLVTALFLTCYYFFILRDC